MTKQEQAEMMHEIYFAQRTFCAYILAGIRSGKTEESLWEMMMERYSGLAKYWGQIALQTPVPEERDHYKPN